MKKLLLKKQEVAKALGLSIGQINYLVEQNKLEVVEIKPGTARIKRSSVTKYLNSKAVKGVSLSRVLMYLWLAAIIAFSIQLIISATMGINQDWVWSLFFINIGLGIIFFLGAFLTIGKKSTKAIWLPKGSGIWSLPFIYLLLTITPVLASTDMSSSKKTSVFAPIPTISVTPTPTIQAKTKTQVTTNTNTTGSQIDCIGPDGKQFRTTMDECKKLNEKWGKPLDYMVSCNFSTECGGTRYVKKSECVDCAKKAGTTTTTTVNKIPVFLTYGNYTIYCPPQNVDAVKSIDATLKSKGSGWASDFNICRDRYYQTDSCYVACANGPIDVYGTCINGCVSPYTSCDWVYGEQKLLSSQITNLCK